MTKKLAIVSFKTNIAMRDEKFEGRDHVVVPVVALVEGVHNGLYYSVEELSKYVEAWNGIPVPVFHPQDADGPLSANDPKIIESQSVGRFFHVHFDENERKLKGEIWIDVEKARRIAPHLLAAIRGGEPIDVSTALWGDYDYVAGVWNGEKFSSSFFNYRPDHLAVLPGSEGACNWEDGCGIRANSSEGEMKVRGGVVNWVLTKLGLNELSHDDVRSKIYDSIRALDTGTYWHYIRDVFDDTVVYEANLMDPNIGPVGSAKLYQRSYKVDEDGVVTLGEEVTQVREDRRYLPVENSQTKEEVTMTKQETIRTLIADPRTKFEADDEKWLRELSPEQLAKFTPCPQKAENSAEKTEETEETVETPVNTKTEVTTPEQNAASETPQAPKPVTLESYVSEAPAEIKEALTRAVTQQRALKAGLVKKMLANKRNKFSEAQLNAKSIEELEILVDMSIEPNYAGQAGGPDRTIVDNDEAPAMPKVFENVG